MAKKKGFDPFEALRMFGTGGAKQAGDAIEKSKRSKEDRLREVMKEIEDSRPRKK